MNKRFAVEGVDAQTPLAEAAPALLRAKAKPLFALEDAARGGADMDAVHDMRVASRRLREAMRLFEPLYPPAEFKSWYRNIRSITRALGPVRDSDVFIDAFAGLAPVLGGDGRRFAAFLLGYRTAQRERELEELNRQLGALELDESRQAFKKLVRRLADPAGARRPIGEFAYSEVAERAAKVFAAQREALDEAAVTAQHELRIHYKRLRYAVEAFAPCYGERFDPLHTTLTAFQDTLGELHDEHVFLEMVRSPERAGAAGRAGIPADGIAEVDRALAVRAHETFVRFTWLAEGHSPERLLPELLLPLVVPEDAESPAPAAAPPEAPAAAVPVRPERRPAEIVLPADTAARPEVALVVKFLDE